MLNPKAALFFLSIFSQFISADTASWVCWAYGTEIVIAVGLWFIFISTVIFSQI
ncbi:LysE family transporter [Priestia aryabhattai]|uniref:LysE family transporter n=1 Tax=Priestia aryabhattai TaxID=412384 RepID=UPI0030C9CA70